MPFANKLNSGLHFCFLVHNYLKLVLNKWFGVREISEFDVNENDAYYHTHNQGRLNE